MCRLCLKVGKRRAAKVKVSKKIQAECKWVGEKGMDYIKEYGRWCFEEHLLF
jgi:hypothetical protein